MQLNWRIKATTLSKIYTAEGSLLRKHVLICFDPEYFTGFWKCAIRKYLRHWPVKCIAGAWRESCLLHMRSCHIEWSVSRSLVNACCLEVKAIASEFLDSEESSLSHFFYGLSAWFSMQACWSLLDKSSNFNQSAHDSQTALGGPFIRQRCTKRNIHGV